MGVRIGLRCAVGAGVRRGVVSGAGVRTDFGVGVSLISSSRDSPGPPVGRGHRVIVLNAE